MSFVLTPFVIALGASAALSAVVAALVLGRCRVPGAAALAALMIAVCSWSVASALEAAVLGQEGKWLFSKLAYLGTVSTGPLFLLFSVHYSLPGARFRPAPALALWIVPGLVMGAAFTNEHHGLLWTGMSPGALAGSNLMIYGHGIVFWVMIIYQLLTVLAGTVLLARSVLRLRGGRGMSRPYATQSAIILAAVAAPWVGFALYVSPFNPFPGLELSVIFFSITGLLLLLGITRYRLFDLVPVAWQSLVEGMSDAVLVLDRQNRVVDLNPAALRLLALRRGAVGQPLEQVLAAWPELVQTLAAAGDEELETEITWNGESPRHTELRISRLQDRRGQRIGRFAVLHDVTARKRAEAEREHLIAQLQQALADIKSLRGLLPICASCKKIRDDKGYWRNLEHYLAEHSEAQFSHGLCPECMARLYPEFRSAELP
ncbi:MAG: PAS domain-containing protein, partial [Spirochaetales bacterium]|nr:PAS domain-containing protein [Spirochaetales bacterium]